jgi:hypothetical protein
MRLGHSTDHYAEVAAVCAAIRQMEILCARRATLRRRVPNAVLINFGTSEKDAAGRAGRLNT